jgi:thymidylate kinase
MRLRGEREQIFDGEGIEFHERVREGYLAQAEGNESFTVLNGLAPKMVVARAIANRVLRDIATK